MIYKNGVRVERVEFVIDEEDQDAICRLHLSDENTFSSEHIKIPADIFHNQTKMELLALNITGRTLKLLREEMNDKA